MKIFSISGFWKDDKSEFEHFLVAEYDDVPEGYDEEDIFYFGLSEEDILNSCLEDGLEFVITYYYQIEQ